MRSTPYLSHTDLQKALAALRLKNWELEHKALVLAFSNHRADGD